MNTSYPDSGRQPAEAPGPGKIAPGAGGIPARMPTDDGLFGAVERPIIRARQPGPAQRTLETPPLWVGLNDLAGQTYLPGIET